MSSAKLYNQQGQAIGTVELDDKVFALKPNRGLIEQAVTTILANRRPVLAHTQTKGEVRGGGRKPWRQKGTGRARHGSIRSPQWKGGGVIFGPRKNRNFSIKMNVSSKRQAMMMTLSDKVAGDRLVVLDKIALPATKTKEFSKVLNVLPHRKTNLVVMPKTDQQLITAGRNIPGVTFIRADSLNVYDVLRHQQIFVLQESLPIISKTFAK